MSPHCPSDSKMRDLMFHAKPIIGGSGGSISASEYMGAISIAFPL
jgi:hypothetical protein